MNPTKASIVKDIADYEWSSYREIFDALNITKQESHITEATVRSEVYGSCIFHSEISKLLQGQLN